jgi:hypothetical protein
MNATMMFSAPGFWGKMKTLLYLLNILLFSAPAFAQTATLRGLVTDESGALVSRAKVTLTEPSGLVKDITSATDGSYSFADVPFGVYRVEVSAPERILPQSATVNLRSSVQVLYLQLKVPSNSDARPPTRALPPVPQERARVAEAIRVVQAPKLDGSLDDPLWQSAKPVADFRQREPYEGEKATENTEVRIL